MGVFWGGKLGTAEAKSSMQASPAFSCKACSHRTSSLIPYCCSWGEEGGGEMGDESKHGLLRLESNGGSVPSVHSLGVRVSSPPNLRGDKEG